MNVLSVNDKAPDFSMTATNGQSVKLADFAGNPLILYFYPKDDTPGCTVEACNFRDSISRFTGLKASVLGISKDSVASHAKFAQKYSLPFLLASDPEGQVCKAYGAWGEKRMMGKKYMGIIRSTFLIGPDGRVVSLWRNVKVDGHVNEVAEALSALD